MSMQDLYIAPQKNIYFVPEVRLIVETGICTIEGESYIEEAPDFYLQIQEWVNAYFAEGYKSITFNFRLSYFNTSSSRCIVDLMRLLAKYHQMGNEIVINWYVQEGDEDLQEEIEEFQKEIDFHLNIFPLCS